MESVAPLAKVVERRYLVQVLFYWLNQKALLHFLSQERRLTSVDVDPLLKYLAMEIRDNKPYVPYEVLLKTAFLICEPPQARKLIAEHMKMHYTKDVEMGELLKRLRKVKRDLADTIRDGV